MKPVDCWTDPYAYLDQQLEQEPRVIDFPGNQKYLADVEDAQNVLTNAEGYFNPEHSDFFYIQGRYLGPREVQQDIGRSAIRFLNQYSEQHKTRLTELTAKWVSDGTSWPDNGNWLFYHYFKDALLGNTRSKYSHQLLRWVVQRSVCSGAKLSYPNWQRRLFSVFVKAEFSRQIKKAQQQKDSGQIRDIIDILVVACPADYPAEDLCEIYLSFVFACIGSVGFTLGWSLYLLGSNPDAEHKASYVVREALRLWPVAWNLGRQPQQSYELAGHEITPEHMVVACPYAVHRNPKYWTEAAKFQPERWASADSQTPFLAFGWGEHKCVAAALSMRLVELVLLQLQSYRIKIEDSGLRPLAQPALAPAPFVLRLLSRSDTEVKCQR